MAPQAFRHTEREGKCVVNMSIVGFTQIAECMGCEKSEQQCVVLKTEGYTGPHCAKCVMREAKKRAGNTQATATSGVQAISS